jgi:pyruvate/2-oxoacid:ferredoxin oxidoreductase beta subunit
VEFQDLMYAGHNACPGCAAPLAMRYTLNVLGPKTVVAMPACCWSTIAGPYPWTSLQVPLLHTAFATAASVSSGVRAALDIKGQSDINVLAWAGDGGTFDIGFQALSGAVERNENIIYACYDNEAYMNTGIQRSSSTPWGAWTKVTPSGNPEDHPKKDIVEILAAHRIPYAATVSVAFPEDFQRKVEQAKAMRGTRFLHILAPCPPGWKIPSELSVRLARLAVETKVFPLYEVEHGTTYNITYQPKGLPVEEYFELQGRFKHLAAEEMAGIQERVELEWKALQRRAGLV